MAETEYNVRLITLDSCRFDSAQSANTPVLDSAGPLRMAEADATYTYPAHHSLFIGFLPRIIGPDQKPLADYDAIWKSEGARPTTKRILEHFSEPNILDHYEGRGFNVQGFGGVGFFNPDRGTHALPHMFEDFTYFGPRGTSSDYAFPRPESSFPLGNLDEIIDRTRGEDPYFLFINSPETHIPYDSPFTIVDDRFQELMDRLVALHSSNRIWSEGEMPFDPEEIEVFKDAQVRALEWIDQQLGLLFPELSNDLPNLTIVTGDHGEEFGEEGRFGHAHNAQAVREIPIWIGME